MRQLVHINTQYRGPAFMGGITIMDGSVTEKSTDDKGRQLVHVDFVIKNQLGTVMAKATGEIALPTRD
jgi:hypothetical protein